MVNSALQFALRSLIVIAKHPATQTYAKHLLRAGTAQLVRTVRSRTARRSPSL